MGKRHQPTEEQKAKAAERRAAFRQLNSKLAAMDEEQRAHIASKMIAVTRCVGGYLSFTNSMLVWMQKENATMVGGFEQWRLCGRKVKKGESGISIWIPKGSSKEQDATPSTDDQRPGFFMGYVWDIGQTEPIDGAEIVLPALEVIAPSFSLENAPQARPAPAATVPAAPVVNTKLVAKLRQLADTMQADIDNKIHNSTGEMNWTARRARIAEGLRQDGYKLEKVQTALRALADAHEAGTIPPSLSRISNRQQVKDLLYQKDEQLLALLDGKLPDREAEEKVRQLETKVRELVGQIPGFFPSPSSVVREIMNFLNVQEDDFFLDPEAGAGAIALAALERTKHVDVIEVSWTLCDFLTTRGFEPMREDFLEKTPNPIYHKIGMNPPFEGGQDVAHIRHAYEFLAPGGRLVGVTSEGTWHNSARKFVEFREWVETLGGFYVELPAGAFAESGTNVATRLVILDK